LVGQLFANVGGDLGMLKEKCTLKVLPAVQTGAQNEMTIEQRTGLPKQAKQVFAHLGSARIVRATFGAPAECTTSIQGVFRPKEFPARAPETAREARALPRRRSRVRRPFETIMSSLTRGIGSDFPG